MILPPTAIFVVSTCKEEIGLEPRSLLSWLQCCIYYVLSGRKDAGWEIQLFSRFKVQGTFIIPEWQFVVQPAEKPGKTARTLSFFPLEFMFQLSPVNLIPSKNVQKNYCGCHISEPIVLEIIDGWTKCVFGHSAWRFCCSELNLSLKLTQ